MSPDPTRQPPAPGAAPRPRRSTRSGATASRTINPLHFEDLEPHRFEDLIRQLAHGFRTWRTLHATGRLGNDEGVDIRGWEVERKVADDQDASEDLDDPSDREWRIQVKRRRRLGPADLKAIVEEAVPDVADAPYGLIVAAACDVSADGMAAFRGAALERGIIESHLWTNAHLEDLLFLPENDHLLFAYFGISIVTRRRSQLAPIRADIGLKRKLVAALDDKDLQEFLHQEAVVRDVDASSFPDPTGLNGHFRDYAPPWHSATIRFIRLEGVVVERYFYEGIVMPDGTWDIRQSTRSWQSRNARAYWDAVDEGHGRQGGFEPPAPESGRTTIYETRLLPWSNILEIDPLGGLYLPGPHLICRFEGEDGPFQRSPRFHAFTQPAFSGITGRTDLLADQRRQLFEDPAGAPRAKPVAGTRSRKPKSEGSGNG